jgi:hypothetical protein
MPLFTEDVIIRILADSTSGVREIRQTNAELKKMGGQATRSAKDLLKIGASFGGITAAIDLGVKAITAYIQKVKESEDAYIEAAKAEGAAATAGILAYEALEAAKQRQMEIDGALHNAHMAQYRERRAARIEESNMVKQMTEEQMNRWREANRGLTKFNEAFQSRLEFMEEEQRQLEETTARQEELTNAYAQFARAMSGTGEFAQDTDTRLADMQAIVAEEMGHIEQLSALGVVTDEAAAKTAFLNKIVTELVRGEGGYAEWSEFISGEGGLIEQIRLLNDEAAKIEKIKTPLKGVAEMMDTAFDTQQQIANLNALGNAMSGFLGAAFGETKGAAIAQALINQALAISNIWANFAAFPPLAAGLTALAVATTGAQIANIQSQSYANGTPPGGFTGTSDDSIVRVSSRQRLHVQRDNGEPMGGPMMGDVYLDGRYVGKWFNNASDRNVIRPNSRSVVTR